MFDNPTPAERKMRDFLMSNQIKFTPQAVIFPYIIDFLLWEKSIALELDGGHHEDSTQFCYDNNRDSVLGSLGILTIRIKNDEFEKYKYIILEDYKGRKFHRCANLVGKHNHKSCCDRNYEIIINRFEKCFRRYLSRILYYVFKTKLRRIYG